MGEKHYTTNHHTIPKSRGGVKQKTVDIPKNFHKAWHDIFCNLYGDECILFIEEVNELMLTKGGITGNNLAKIRAKIRGEEITSNEVAIESSARASTS